MSFLKKLVKNFEDDMTAAAIAQAGDTEFAREILGESAAGKHQEHHCQENQKMVHLSVEPAEGK